LDVLILSCLRGSSIFISRQSIYKNIDNPYWSVLQNYKYLNKNQILVDEATDFSPIQLACMFELSNPAMRSFFACGDFNQRLTKWGTKSIDEFKWFAPSIGFEHVNISYRQSKQLNDLSHTIIDLLGGDTRSALLPHGISNDGIKPSLHESSDLTSTYDWLASQIRFIDGHLSQLPSTAIFVNNEESIRPLANSLNELLQDSNIQVVACPMGQVMGSDNDVRVFDIQHIKGLEFEAVFFIGIDNLAIENPDLFSKYIYVGATRAATYLGLTCNNKLPEVLEPLRMQFIDKWD